MRQTVSHYSFFIVLLVIISSASLAQEKSISLGGYLENRFYAQYTDRSFSLQNLSKTMRLGDYNRARIELQSHPASRVNANLTVDYFTFHGFFKQRTGFLDPVANTGVSTTEQLLRIDRANIQITYPHADIMIGMQRIAWGRSMLWSPFDVFRRVNLIEPREEVRGVNALKLTIPVTSLTNIQAVYMPEERLNESPAGIRFMSAAGKTDLAFSAIYNRNNLLEQKITGIDLKGEFHIGWWMEYAYYSEKILPNRPYIPLLLHTTYNRTVMGIDYTFNTGNGLYVMAEYYRDGSGKSDKMYDYQKLFGGYRYTLARDYLLSNLNYRWNQSFTIQYTAVSNLNDKTIIHIPACTWEFVQGCEFTVGFHILSGPTGGEFRPVSLPNIPQFTGNQTLFLWLKIYF
ncbi:MAG: hypothetical protein M1426_06140 [Patescibacteria group bacterium]|nr:hypothetical protein [Patescibacteria group bacterium]